MPSSRHAVDAMTSDMRGMKLKWGALGRKRTLSPVVSGAGERRRGLRRDSRAQGEGG